MPHTFKTTVLATYIKTLIDTNKVALLVDQVLYGDHAKIPGGVTVVVNSGIKNRRLEGVAFPGARTRNQMTVLVMIYNNRTGSESEQRLITDQIAENVEHLLHQNTTMGGNIIHGFVESWDPGMRYKDASMFRAVQLVFVGQSKTNLTDIP